jgi:hypothetical protein
MYNEKQMITCNKDKKHNRMDLNNERKYVFSFSQGLFDGCTHQHQGIGQRFVDNVIGDE